MVKNKPLSSDVSKYVKQIKLNLMVHNGLGLLLRFIGRIKTQEVGCSMMLYYRTMQTDNAFN
jgi:hypothetical protein